MLVIYTKIKKIYIKLINKNISYNSNDINITKLTKIIRKTNIINVKPIKNKNNRTLFIFIKW